LANCEGEDSSVAYFFQLCIFLLDEGRMERPKHVVGK